MTLQTVLKVLKKNNPKADLEIIKKAYYFAEEAHKHQKRASGTPFIEHPLNVALILAELNLDEVTIASAFLHDVVEDTSVSIDEITKEFGGEIASLVDGVTKINKLQIKDQEEYHAESIRKVIMASTRDIRVIFIKLADKLHNMRTLNYFRPEKQERIAREVMDVYAPIAYKLGIASLKWELEDLAFKYLEPEKYEELNNKIKKSKKQRDEEIKKIISTIKEELAKNGLHPEITGRPKHIYSVCKKMQRKNCTFEQVYDLAALRIITKTVKECYESLGVLHNFWKPVPKEFDDYIAMPKSNMYQSLHTVLIMPGGQHVEIQIRTEEMHNVAEEGIAAHWHYKGVEGDKKFDTKLSWLKQILEWQQESKDAKEFMEMLHIDFFEDEIFTFTPKGRVVELPKGASPLDFAYAIHSNIGDHATGAKVNGKFVPLRTLLKNGDMIEILTSKTQKPSRDWLKIVKTSKAQSKIKQFIRATETIPVKSVPKIVEEKKELEEWIIRVENMQKPEIRLAKCCLPLPGDEIIGFSTKTGKVTIHKKICPAVHKVVGEKKKKVIVRWIDNLSSLIEIKVNANNRVGLFAEILNNVVSTQTIIKTAAAKSISDTDVQCSFAIESRGLNHLQDLIRRIKKVKDVKNVYIEPLPEI